MMAVGLIGLGIGVTFVLSGVRGQNPLDVFRAVFTGQPLPEPALRLPPAVAAKVAGAEQFADAQAQTSPTGTPTIVEWQGAKLASHVMPQYQGMILAAARDGVTLRPGSTFRSNAEQINLRRAHCGSSQYDIFQKPSNQCSPPTARPGASMHERGEAVDFANLSAAGFAWLKANAARFGFHNLPSERWHWSTNGN